MSDIEFETDKAIREIDGNKAPTDDTPRMVKLVMKLGVKDVATANYVLLGTALLFIAITIYLYAGILGDPSSKPSADEIRAMQMIPMAP